MLNRYLVRGFEAEAFSGAEVETMQSRFDASRKPAAEAV